MANLSYLYILDVTMIITKLKWCAQSIFQAHDP